ncbi:MAG: hypothetical protein V4492_08115 [Chlamydiota bacterium]
MKQISIEYALLSAQRSLLDVVTPELRAVVVDVCHEDNLMYMYFYYDGEVSEKLIDLWQCATAEASAPLGPDCFLDYGVERLDYPKEIPLRGRYAYLRKGELFQGVGFPFRMGEGQPSEYPIANAMLAVQRAMLGIVSPELRSVVVDAPKGEHFLYIRFYYEGEVTQELIALWQRAIVEASRDFGSEYQLDGAVERVDYPQEIPFRGRFAYFRKE